MEITITHDPDEQREAISIRYLAATTYPKAKITVKCNTTGKQRRIMETFEKVLPSLTEPELDRLLAFGEGMAFKAQQQGAAQLTAWPKALRMPEGGPGGAACPAP